MTETLGLIKKSLRDQKDELDLRMKGIETRLDMKQEHQSVEANATLQKKIEVSDL